MDTLPANCYCGAFEPGVIIDKSEAKKLLKENGLRVTAPRLAVVRVLANADGPLAHSEVLTRLTDSDWDPATVYRNLVKLKDAGLAVVVSRADGLDRYEIAGAHEHDHKHPHFLCEDCGQVMCLPIEVVAAVSTTGRWACSVENAVLQLRGECPDCISPSDAPSLS